MIARTVRLVSVVTVLLILSSGVAWAQQGGASCGGVVVQPGLNGAGCAGGPACDAACCAPWRKRCDLFAGMRGLLSCRSCDDGGGVAACGSGPAGGHGRACGAVYVAPAGCGPVGCRSSGPVVCESPCAPREKSCRVLGNGLILGFLSDLFCGGGGKCRPRCGSDCEVSCGSPYAGGAGPCGTGSMGQGVPVGVGGGAYGESGTAPPPTPPPVALPPPPKPAPAASTGLNRPLFFSGRTRSSQ